MTKETTRQQTKLDRNRHKTDVTARISETSRFLGFGVVAWVFAQHSSSSNFSLSYVADFGVFVRIAGVLGVVAILFDYLQYLAAFAVAKKALKNESNDYAYDQTYWASRLQSFFFWGKQFSVLIASLIVVATFAMTVIPTEESDLSLWNMDQPKLAVLSTSVSQVDFRRSPRAVIS